MEINNILQHLFKKSSLEEVPLNALTELTVQYPYFATGHFLLSKKLKQNADEDFKARLQKTNLYFHDTLWLHYLLKEDRQQSDELITVIKKADNSFTASDLAKETEAGQALSDEPVEEMGITPQNDVQPDGEVVVADNTNIQSDEAVITEDNTYTHSGEAVITGNNTNAQSSEDIESNTNVQSDEAVITEDNTHTHSGEAVITGNNTNAQSGEDIESNTNIQFDEAVITEANTNEPAGSAQPEMLNSQTAKDAAATPHETVIIKAVEDPETGQPDNGNAPSAGNTETPFHETIVVQSAAGSEVLQQDNNQQTGENGTKILSESEPVDENSEITGAPDASGEKNSMEDNTFLENNKVGGFLRNNHSLPAHKEEKGLTFDPYHTIDYFASLGIRLSQEIKPDDKLGDQLKSFTQWLKTMKRLPSGALENPGVMQPFENAQIEKIAAHSLEEKEILTEAMAEVLIKQGKMEKARNLYHKLSLLNPDKSAYFAAKIEELKQY